MDGHKNLKVLRKPLGSINPHLLTQGLKIVFLYRETYKEMCVHHITVTEESSEDREPHEGDVPPPCP